MRLVPALFLMSALLAPGLAWGDAGTPLHDPREAHAVVDTNDDGEIDHEELHHRLVDVFFYNVGRREYEQVAVTCAAPRGNRKRMTVVREARGKVMADESGPSQDANGLGHVLLVAPRAVRMVPRSRETSLQSCFF